MQPKLTAEAYAEKYKAGKQCCHCYKVLPLGAFDPRAKGDVRRKPNCVACTREKAKAHYQRKKAQYKLAPITNTAALPKPKPAPKPKPNNPRTTEPRKCRLCEQVLPASEFHSDKRSPSGLNARCKECHRLTRRKQEGRKRRELRERYGATAAGQRGQSVRYERALGKYQEPPARLNRRIPKARCGRCGGVAVFSEYDDALICLTCSARVYIATQSVRLGMPEADAS